MISVDEALAELFSLVTPLEPEHIPLRAGTGRVLSEPAKAQRTQPPFAASSMDGYAIKSVEAEPDAMFRVIGEAPAGHMFEGDVGPGQAVRIFTGAPLPKGSDTVVIQEDVTRSNDLITLANRALSLGNVRAAGSDFHEGDEFTPTGPLTSRDIAVLAAMNHSELSVIRRPEVAILPTGDELVQPGETPAPDQIIASNSYGLASMLEAHGAIPRLLPIARDSVESLQTAFGLASGADLLVTIGGASVGDHDLMGSAASELGLDRAFYKVAMRPGKPLMAGKLGALPVIGLPGNPVSAMVCGVIFLLPVIRAMLGLPQMPATRISARLTHDLPKGGPREHYMRAQHSGGGVTVYEQQDSSLLGVLAQANVLAVRPPHDPPRKQGDAIDVIMLNGH